MPPENSATYCAPYYNTATQCPPSIIVSDRCIGVYVMYRLFYIDFLCCKILYTVKCLDSFVSVENLQEHSPKYNFNTKYDILTLSLQEPPGHNISDMSLLLMLLWLRLCIGPVLLSIHTMTLVCVPSKKSHFLNQ